jgi:hypothetical protein
MSTSFSKSTKTLWFPSAFFIVALSLFILVSCKEKKYATNPTCMKLTKEQIQNWIKKGFTSGKDSIVYLRIKTAYGGPGTVFRAFVEGLTGKGDLVPQSLTELKAGDKCEVGLDDTYMVISPCINKFSYEKFFEKMELKKAINEIIIVPETIVDTTTKLKFLNYRIKDQEGVFTLDTMDWKFLPCPPCPNCPDPAKCKGSGH